MASAGGGQRRGIRRTPLEALGPDLRGDPVATEDLCDAHRAERAGVGEGLSESDESPTVGAQQAVARPVSATSSASASGSVTEASVA